MELPEGCLRPDWPAPARVSALSTARRGGVSQPPYASLNLGVHVGDDPAAVAENRRRLRQCLPAEPLWLTQVHGTRVVAAEAPRPPSAPATTVLSPPEADASFTRIPGTVCGVLTADCLPVLFCDRAGSVVAAAHAGWRGLAAGVLENTVAAMGVPGKEVLAWLGPAIGPNAFEVGDDVRDAFVAWSIETASRSSSSMHASPATPIDPAAGIVAGADIAAAFHAQGAGKWRADLYRLARLALARAGVVSIYGGGWCTASDAAMFFSHRRDGVSGRMASLIWLDRA